MLRRFYDNRRPYRLSEITKHRHREASSTSISGFHDTHSIKSNLYFSYRCCVCNESISGRVITAMGKKFHPGCFVCSYCRQELRGRTFKTDDASGVPYCHQCFEKLLGHFGSAQFRMRDLGQSANATPLCV